MSDSGASRLRVGGGCPSTAVRHSPLPAARHARPAPAPATATDRRPTAERRTADGSPPVRRTPAAGDRPGHPDPPTERTRPPQPELGESTIRARARRSGRRGRWWFVLVPAAVIVLRGSGRRAVPAGPAADRPAAAGDVAAGRAARTHRRHRRPASAADGPTASASPSADRRATTAGTATGPPGRPGRRHRRHDARRRRPRPPPATRLDRRRRRPVPRAGRLRRGHLHPARAVRRRRQAAVVGAGRRHRAQRRASCLDVMFGGRSNGTPVMLYPCHGGDSQQWRSSGERTWRNPQSNRCLTAGGPAPAHDHRRLHRRRQPALEPHVGSVVMAEETPRRQARRERSRPSRPTTWSPPRTASASSATPPPPGASCCARRSSPTTCSTGTRPEAEVFLTAYTLDGADPLTRPVTFAFNGGPGSSSVWLHLGLLGPRRVVMGDAGALTPPPYGLADNHETLLAAVRPGLHRPDLDRLLAGGQGRQAQGLPRLHRRHRVRRRGDPAVDLAQRPVAVAEVPVRRVVRHAARGGAGPAPADAVRHVPQRAHADLVGARPRHAGVRGPQRRPVPAVPADVRGDRALPRPARRPPAARGARRGRGVRRARLPVGAGPRRPADRRASAPTPSPRWPGSPACRPTTSTGSTCASSTCASSPSCCARAGARSAGWTGGSSAGTPTTAASTGAPTRRTTRSWGRTRRRSTTTCATELGYAQRPAVQRSLTDKVHPWSCKEFEGKHLYVGRQAGGRDARQPAPAGARRLRLPRRRDARTSPPSTRSRTWRSRPSCAATSRSSTTRPAT